MFFSDFDVNIYYKYQPVIALTESSEGLGTGQQIANGGWMRLEMLDSAQKDDVVLV